MKFSLKRKEHVVELMGDDNVERRYFIRELTGKDRDTYLNFVSPRMSFDDKGNALGIRNISGLAVQMLSMCLFDEAGKLVPRSTIETWPASLLDPMFRKGMELSALEAGASEAAGNG